MQNGISPSRTIRVKIDDARYPINEAVMRQVFQSSGSIEQIDVLSPEHRTATDSSASIFTVIASIKFRDVHAAIHALQNFHSKPIYPGCCYMSIQYVNTQVHPALMPMVPQQQPVMSPATMMMNSAPTLPAPQMIQSSPHFSSTISQHSFSASNGPLGNGMHPHGMEFPYGQQQSGYEPRAVYQPQSGYESQSGYQPNPQQYHYYPESTGGRGFGARGGYAGRGMGRGRGRGGTNGYIQTPFNGMAPQQDQSCVLVCGFAQGHSLKELFVLLEVYANVLGMKRLSKQNPDQVLVRFQHEQDARSVVHYVHGTPFFDSMLQLRIFVGYDISRSFACPQGLPADDPSCWSADFTTGVHHRHVPGALVHARRYKPSEHLFVGNLTSEITDDMVNKWFNDKGFTVVDFSRKNDIFCILSLESTSRAAEALVAIHAMNVADRFIKVTFSGFSPQSVPPGAAGLSQS